MFKIIVSTIFIILTTISTIYPFEPFFNSRIDYPMGDYINTIAYSDFNNDGYIDFACGASYYADQSFTYLNIFMNNGDGTYKDPIKVENGFYPSVIIASDLNNDGWNDLVTVTNYSDLNIIMNHGDGTLVLQDNYSGLFSEYITIMDMNNDGFNDIISINGTTIEVSLNNGDGTFSVGDNGEKILKIGSEFSGRPIPWKVNNDDFTDLLIYGFKITTQDSVNYIYEPAIGTFANDGGISFHSLKGYIHSPSSSNPILGFETGYFDADSEIDIIISDFESNRIVLTNDGDGSFTERCSFTMDYNTPITVSDINNDGFSDIVISDSKNGNVFIQINNGTSEMSFADKVGYMGKYGTNPTFKVNILSVDINNDDYDDIIQTQYYLSTIFNNGHGTFPIYKSLENMGSGNKGMLSDDFNNDGFSDILTLDESSVYISYNNGNGFFLQPNKYATSLDRNTGVFAGFFNEDDILDFGITAYNGLKLFYGSESGIFQRGDNLQDSLGFFAGYGGLSGDFNDDGIIDLATFYGGSYDLNVILSDDLGGYHLSSYNLPNVINTIHSDIAAADLDNDNDLDIVVGSANKAIYINYNDGDGDFSTYTTLSTEEIVFGVSLADYNNDGFIDLAATQAYGTGSILVYLNDREGAFLSEVEYGEFRDFRYDKIYSEDMDNDGDYDLITNLEGGGIGLFLNKGDGTFPFSQYYSGGDTPVQFTIADFDSDSTKDIAVMNGLPSRNSVFIFPNLGGTATFIELDNNKLIIPSKIELSQNYPNPFNPSTTIKYSIPNVGDEYIRPVQLKVYDILGREVVTLVNQKQQPGNYSVQFDASGLTSGMYIYKLSAGEFVSTKKMILLK